LRGALSALLGLLLATVGLDRVCSTNRFTLGDLNMVGGLNFVAVLIGSFAIPEVLAMVWHPTAHLGKARSLGNNWVSVADYKKSFRSIVRGSFIGVFLGSIPGIGAAPSAFLSYSEARRRSKDKANFGKGEVEGVAASKAGNNGVAGATLIPLLALGVPGDVITAIIIGAFTIHRLQPGPMMFIPSVRSDLRVVHRADRQFDLPVFHRVGGDQGLQLSGRRAQTPVDPRGSGAVHLWRFCGEQ